MNRDKFYRTIEIPKPHCTIQKAMMICFLDKDITEAYFACGTKFGKSLGISGGMAGAAALSRGHLYRWIAPIYSQSKIGYKYIKKYLPPPPITEHNKSEPSITLPELDTRIEFKSGLSPEDLEGEATHKNALDEMAKMKEQVYFSVKTTTTVTRGLIAGFSTPKGKNHFYTRCMNAKDEYDWAIQRKKKPTKIFLTAPTAANPFVQREAIADAERNLPDRLFRQYYLAEFVEDGSVFIGFRQCYYTDEIILNGTLQQWFHDDSADMEVVLAADWAKHSDYTVFGAFKAGGQKPKLVGFVRFQNVKYTEGVKSLVAFAKRFKKTGFGLHDKTGVGEAIDELIAMTDLPMDGIVFNNKNKTDFVNKLMVAFERQAIELPWINTIEQELEVFEVETTPSGNMTYNAPSGSHDDCISMLILGYQAWIEYSGSSEIKFLEDLPKSKISIDSLYEELAEDSGDIFSILGLKG